MAEVQYNRNNYNDVINEINNIMKRSNCVLPVRFTNIWANRNSASDLDRQKMITWQNQLVNQLKKNNVNCHNIVVAYNMGVGLYNMYNKMIKIKGPLANYYNACLWEVTKMFLNMMNDVLINKEMLLTPEFQLPINNISYSFNKTYDCKKKYNNQYQRWTRKYNTLTNAYEKSQRNFYKFDKTTDGFLWEVYNSTFITKKLEILYRYGNQIDPFLR